MSKAEEYFTKIREGLVESSEKITFTKLYLLKFAEAYHQSRVNAIIKEQSHPDTLEESEFQEAYYALYEQLLKQ